MTERSHPADTLYCPVCERQIAFIYLWQDPGNARIRLFCEDCSHLPDYQDLPKDQRTILNLEGFQRFAGARLLEHVTEKERAKGDR